MKKIMYLGGFELPNKNAAAQRVNNVATVIRKAGNTVTLCGYSKEIKKNTFIKKSEDIYVKGQSNDIKGIVNKFLLIKNEKKIIEKKDPDIVILYNYPAFKILLLEKYLKNNNKKLVLDITEYYSLPRLKNFTYLFKYLDRKLRMEYIIPKYKNVIFISEALKSRYLNVENTIVIPGLVNLKNKVINKKNKVIRFCYIGDPGKKFSKERIDIIVDVISTLNSKGIHCIFDIIGISKSHFLNEIEEINHCDHIKKINFYGKVSHEKSLKILSESDITIIPREDNLANIMGFPTKLGESLALGKAVIITPVGDMKNYIVENENGYVLESLEKEYLEKKFIKIINDFKLGHVVFKGKFNNLLDVENYPVNKVKEFIGKIC